MGCWLQSNRRRGGLFGPQGAGLLLALEPGLTLRSQWFQNFGAAFLACQLCPTSTLPVVHFVILALLSENRWR